MICHTHSKEAIGVCRVCGRGLCSECGTEAGNALVCLNRCEERSKKIEELISSNIHQNSGPDRTEAVFQLNARNHLEKGVIWIIVGVFFGYVLQSNSFPKEFVGFSFLGLAFGVVFSVVNISAYKKWKNLAKSLTRIQN